MKKDDIVRLLRAKGEEQESLFIKARKEREKYFGNKAVIRAVIEISNHCIRTCEYCGMKTDNKELKRYSIRPEEIIDRAHKIKKMKIETILLQGGENSETTETTERVLQEIQGLGLTSILCLGNKSRKEYKRLKEAGAEGYILKHETSDLCLHYLIRHQSLKERLQCLELLLGLRYKVGTGTIVGLPGQSIESIADDILLAKKYNVDMVSAAPFIPNNQTSFRDKPYGNLDLTLNTMALMRLVLPRALIPAVSALKILHQDGQIKGLDAGANVITINATPSRYKKDYIIYTSNRQIVGLDYAKSVLEKAGLVHAGLKD